MEGEMQKFIVTHPILGLLSIWLAEFSAVIVTYVLVTGMLALLDRHP
jgi:hypothetical protein